MRKLVPRSVPSQRAHRPSFARTTDASRSRRPEVRPIAHPVRTARAQRTPSQGQRGRQRELERVVVVIERHLGGKSEVPSIWAARPGGSYQPAVSWLEHPREAISTESATNESTRIIQRTGWLCISGGKTFSDAGSPDGASTRLQASGCARISGRRVPALEASLHFAVRSDCVGPSSRNPVALQRSEARRKLSRRPASLFSIYTPFTANRPVFIHHF